MKNDLKKMLPAIQMAIGGLGYLSQKYSEMNIPVSRIHDGLIIRTEDGKEYKLTIEESLEYNKYLKEWHSTNYLKDDIIPKMYKIKFYEFTRSNFKYYALIGAISEDEAIRFYKIQATKEIDKDAKPTVISQASARKILLENLNLHQIYEDDPDYSSSIENFETSIFGTIPYFVVSDDRLVGPII